ASHAGVTLGEDGATHQTMEDVALMRALPGMTVLVPCDYNQTLQATLAAARFEGPVYLRFGRPSVPNFTNPDEPFEIGKVYNMNPGKDITIAAMGLLVWEALQAAEMLEKEGISAEVLNVSTVKPLDCKAIIDSLAKTGCAVVAEEHGMAGGLGELLSGVAAAHKPVPFEFVNGGDRFGESGTPAELIEEFGLNAANIAAAAKKAISRK
ncbi:MAG TPA: transketolase C-terminal domain-containing protein, partial [Candidatus Cryptobacteroides sp.]|nr:transketolase C-terminal domain-containing protein [Candidatus Cryptobacteroides sp.]